MTLTPLSFEELEARLQALHADSFGWACACCQWNETDAEDVLQTTYVKVISGKARYDGRAAFRTWLFGVIRFTALEHRRRQQSQDERAVPAADADLVMGTPPEAPDEAVVQSEQAAALKRALRELPERQAEVLNLVFYEGLSIREASEVMDVSLGSARVHYDRGKKRLRGLLQPHEPGSEAL